MAKYLKQQQNASKTKDLNTKVSERVSEIIKEVEIHKDLSVRKYSKIFDNWAPESFRLNREQIEDVLGTIPAKVLDDIKFAQKQIRNFAEVQKKAIHDVEVENYPGVILGHKNIPINSVGCYIPGGRYPMVASSHMSILTAKVAGVKRVVGATPPIKGEIPKETVAAMYLAGADEIYVLGGVQALAAMAFGTETIPAVDMLVGPGNVYVAEAKRQLMGRVGIDLIAGPTEILVIADETADAQMIATDILGQAEHGPTSPGALITTSENIARETLAEIESQLINLPTRDVASVAWKENGAIILVKDDNEAIIEADRLAYEHVEVMTKNPHFYLDNLTNYGALFLGPETNVAYGDKVIGTNHILPTNGAARYTGGLWVGKFLKTCTYQKCTKEASIAIGRYAMRLCEIEGFWGHKEQAALRVRRYDNEEKIV